MSQTLSPDTAREVLTQPFVYSPPHLSVRLVEKEPKGSIKNGMGGREEKASFGCDGAADTMKNDG